MPYSSYTAKESNTSVSYHGFIDLYHIYFHMCLFQTEEAQVTIICACTVGCRNWHPYPLQTH